MPSLTENTQTRKGSRDKAAPPILFSNADSFNLFLREMRTAGGAAGFPVTFEATFPIRLSSGSLDGSPPAAGGCFVAVTDSFLKQLNSIPNQKQGWPSVPFRRIIESEPKIVLEDIVDTRRRFCDMIRQMGNYGLRFAFLNDKKDAERLLLQMRAQAAKEQNIQNEAQVVLAQFSGLQDPGVPLSEVLKREQVQAARAAAATKE